MFEYLISGIVPLRSNDVKLIPIVRRYLSMSVEFEPHVTPLNEHHGGGCETLVYADGIVPHEVWSLDSSLAAKIITAVRHIRDVGISAMKAHLTGSAILGNF